MSLNAREEFELLLRSLYPVIYLLTWEEKRVDSEVRIIASELQRKCYFWTLTKGLTPEPPVRKPKTPLTPELEVLAQIHTCAEPGIFVLYDFHPYINDIRVIRLFRDLADRLKDRKQTIVLVSSVLKLPTELEKIITVLDFGLPDSDDIDQKLSDVLLSLRNDPELEINLQSDEREAIIHSATGLTLDEVDNVFARSIVSKKRLDISEILVEKQQIIRKSGTLEYFKQDTTIADVGGLNLLKDWLRKRTVAFSSKAREYGLPNPKGVLLLGVQGGGKSLAAKAVSALWNLPLLRMDMGRIFFGGVVGAPEENIRKSLKVAESVAPCVLWIDELEKGLAGVQSSAFSDAGTTARVFATFLTWMQEKSASVFVVATANDVSMLPPELLRKGRFDEIFFIDLPTIDEREDIIKIHLSKRKRDPLKYEISKIAKETEGFTGAEIEQVIIGSLYSAFDAGREITTKDIIQEANAVVPLSVMMNEDIAGLREWAVKRARPASGVLDKDESKSLVNKKAKPKSKPKGNSAVQ